MTAKEKKEFIDAVQAVYSVSTKAPVEKAIHDTCLRAAQQLINYFEAIEVAEVIEDKELKKA